MANEEMMKYLNAKSQNSNINKQKKQEFTTIKINKDYKLLFNEIAYQRRITKNDLIEQIIIEWCENNESGLLEKFKAKELPEQKK